LRENNKIKGFSIWNCPFVHWDGMIRKCLLKTVDTTIAKGTYLYFICKGLRSCEVLSKRERRIFMTTLFKGK